MCAECDVMKLAIREGRLADCAAQSAADARRSLVQVSRMDVLAAGGYDGVIDVVALKALGSFGLGTFEGLNGELVMLDGRVYRIAGDGSVQIPADDEGVPFANACFFEPERELQIGPVDGFDQLCARLDAALGERARGCFHMVHIAGAFPRMLVRSVRAQCEPYTPLEAVLEADEVRFALKDTQGDIVAIYCPDCAEGIAELGWHLHYISRDRSAGGHVIDLAVEHAAASCYSTDRLDALLRRAEL